MTSASVTAAPSAPLLRHPAFMRLWVLASPITRIRTMEEELAL